jgi:hypothetical protein
MRRTGDHLWQSIRSTANRVVHHVTSQPFEKNISTLSVLKDLVFPVGIYLYFIGFLYTYNFYSAFGIPLNSVEIPFYYFFIYSYDVLAVEPSKTLLLLTFALLAALFIRTRKHPYIGLFLVLSALFPILAVLSKDAAATQVGLLRTGGNLQTIKLIFKDSFIRDDEFLKANDKSELRLVVETKDRLYLLLQKFDEQYPEIPVGSIYSISKSDVLVAKVSLLNIPKPGGK